MNIHPKAQKALGGNLFATGFAVAVLLAASALTPAAAQGTDPQLSPATVEMMATMDGMNPANNRMRMTGDVDRDFMLLMIRHHNAGISMSAAEESYGEHKELKNMAAEDVHAQQKDNREMREYLQHPTAADKVSASGSTADSEMTAAMQKMYQAMNGLKLNGKADHDLMMIPHHEAAITMSKVEMNHGSDPRVKKIAQEMIETQSKDMTGWHKAWYGADYPM